MTNALTELPKKMLILKSHSSGLAATESFLRNRGWEVYSTADLKEALIQVVSKKHSYVLISIDHTNKKIPMLPKLIREKYDIVVMTFAESTSASSFNALTASRTDYKIYAPVTGPAVERSVNKHSKDRETLSRLKIKKDENYSMPLFIRAGEDLENVFVSSKKPTRTGFGTVRAIIDPNEARRQRLSELRKVSDANDSLIARAAQRSLIGNVEILDGFVHNKIEETSTPTCIFIESTRFSGYLIMALGKNQKVEEGLTQKIQGGLCQFLEENGEYVSEAEVRDLKIKEVDFEPWALEYAEFLKTSVHKGNEIAMAFFPLRPISPVLETSNHPDMFKLSIHDLRGDRRIEFALYMQLEANKKFILYTPKGGTFYTKQLERLKTQGVTHMHVPKEDAPAVAKYHAENHLNSLIEDFEEKQRHFGGPAAA
jgi:hypothetical protein